MKKLLISSSLAILIYSIICISSPSFTAAASPQDDQNEATSFLKITATGPVTYGKHTDREKSGERDASHSVSIPVNSDTNAFFDFVPATLQDFTKKNNTTDFRTVFGFHIILN